MNDNETVMLHGLNELSLEYQSLKSWMVNQEKRINELEEIISKITQDNMLAGRKPYRCPCCFGHGSSFDGCQCLACNGSGVVWG